MKSPVVITLAWPRDARGWIGLGCFLLTLLVLGMIWSDRTLLKDDFFKVIATALILNGWNSGPVGWAYQSTKSGNDLAESSARIAETVKPSSSPTDVNVVNTDANAIPVQEAKS